MLAEAGKPQAKLSWWEKVVYTLWGWDKWILYWAGLALFWVVGVPCLGLLAALVLFFMISIPVLAICGVLVAIVYICMGIVMAIVALVDCMRANGEPQEDASSEAVDSLDAGNQAASLELTG